MSDRLRVKAGRGTLQKYVGPVGYKSLNRDVKWDKMESGKLNISAETEIVTD